jgi:hypothetical protein
MSPLRQIALGMVIGVIALGIPVACAGGQLSPLVRCKLEALKVLPADPMNATVYDAVDVIQRVRACHQAADGGST